MDINSTLKLSLSVEDAKTFVTRAMASFLRDKYGINANEEDIKVSFASTMYYGNYDNGPGTPMFNGLEVTINQALPSPRAPYQDR